MIGWRQTKTVAGILGSFQKTIDELIELRDGALELVSRKEDQIERLHQENNELTEESVKAGKAAAQLSKLIN